MKFCRSVFSLTALLLLRAGNGLAQPAWSCGDFSAVQFEYRTATAAQRHRVESVHFTPPVEALIRGSSSYIESDIEYTLLASPNHHRALNSLARLAKRAKLAKLPFMRYSVECYFERAVRFQPDDHIARMLYVQYLTEQARPTEAAAQLEIVAKMAEDNPFTMYNIGLLYFDLKDYARSRQYAKKAMAMGLAKPELQEILQKAGQWQGAETSTPAASAPQ